MRLSRKEQKFPTEVSGGGGRPSNETKSGPSLSVLPTEQPIKYSATFFTIILWSMEQVVMGHGSLSTSGLCAADPNIQTSSGVLVVSGDFWGRFSMKRHPLPDPVFFLLLLWSRPVSRPHFPGTWDYACTPYHWSDTPYITI